MLGQDDDKLGELRMTPVAAGRGHQSSQLRWRLMASSTCSGSVSQSGSPLRRSRVSVAAHRCDGGRTSVATMPRRRARVVAGAGSAGRYPSSRQVPARSGAVGGRQDRSDQLDPLRQIRTARPPRHASSSSGPGCPLTVWHEPDEPGTPSAQRRASSFVRFSPLNSSTFVVSRCHLLSVAAT
jgi:hypothetical protein